MLERIAPNEMAFPQTLELAPGISAPRTLSTFPEGNKAREEA